MAYNEFAYFYDEFNGEADYDALYSQIHTKLEAHGIHDGIVADLGCGTGELTLMLTQAGYDMIGIDQSEEMLCVVRDKAEQLGLSGRLLLLRQDLLKLDLYGTSRGSHGHRRVPFSSFRHRLHHCPSHPHCHPRSRAALRPCGRACRPPRIPVCPHPSRPQVCPCLRCPSPTCRHALSPAYG